MMTHKYKRSGRRNSEPAGDPLIKLEHLAECFKEAKQ